MADDFATYQAGLDSPARHVALGDTLKSNTVDLTHATRGISFSAAGALKIDSVGGESAVVIPSGCLAAGIVHPICATRIYLTGTTVTDLVLYW